MQEQIIPTNPEDAEAMVPVVPEIDVIQGINATIQIGTTTTGEAGTDASVENVGTPTHAILNFTIPKGSKGETGESATIEVAVEAEQLPSGSAPTASIVNSGDKHNADYKLTIGIPKGDTGESATIQMHATATTLSAGSQATATITNSGDSHNANYTLVLGIPRGTDGQDGADGQSATIKVGTVTVTTLAEGSSATATVTNVGTSRDGEFNFTFGIPKGNKGEKGSTGSVKSQYVAELPATGDEDTFYLVDRDLESHTESGEYISFETTQTAAAIQTAQIDGNATQTTYSGKNLWNGAEPLAVTGYGTYALAKPLPAGTYTLSASSITTTGTGAYSLVIFLDSANQTVASDSVTYSTKRKSFTLPSEATQVRIYSQGGYQQSQGVTTTFTKLQLESGSSVTDYEPFVGGTPAPNQEFPMPISVVTGNNTVKIDASDDSQEFPIDLGSTELAQIGTYQDRIYKAREKWYVEKQVGKVVLNSTWNWYTAAFSNAPDYVEYYTGAMDVLASYDNELAISDNFSNTGGTITPSYVPTGECFSLKANAQFASYKLRFAVLKTTASTVSAFKTWLASNPTTVYYALATPTTTEITDQTLIDQLEALASASLNQGINNIFTEIATGNAMPTLELNWVEWEKYNRHNVYIWNDDIDDWQVIVGAGA